MRISFDLDDTLICRKPGVPNEPPLSWCLRILGGDEPLRRGAVKLMLQLESRGWELWVYTTSFRKATSVRRWLWCYGVPVVRVINQDVHDETFATKGHGRASVPSKNPSAFGIDLHVDDSLGVGIEGQKHGFNVVVVSPSDESWAERVLSAAEDLENVRKAVGHKEQGV